MNSSTDVDLERLQKLSVDKPKYKKALDTLVKLRASGYEVMYGWSKGDGFWVRKNGQTLLNPKPGVKNPNFFSTTAAINLLC